MSELTYEAPKKERRPKKDGDWHIVRIYKDALKNPVGLDPLSEKLEQGYEICHEGPSYTEVRAPMSVHQNIHNPQANRFVDMERRAAHVTPDAREGLIQATSELVEGEVEDRIIRGEDD